ncbi:T9SS type A sorting domain-containing protein [Chryseobacterium sp. Marseille-Q3244]|uniref:T9SS type A sorting domain-containing protein n=1 Tax=Chryseobacterium sp. Marseille-Q3244 TaxID=2758092 RepID=UPI002023F072|nr:T9SS type A sorting domain-containing protein [Chryseobacterium sp. Marseille-Q3244]
MVKRILLLFPFVNFFHAQTYPYKDVLWEKSMGGKQSEYLYNAIATPDYGFLLLGSSASDKVNGDQKTTQGDLDFFISKLNENGTEEWKQRFGGDKNDFLTSGALTKDGGYILGGFSYSSLSGDKKESGFGLADYWILKINAEGTIEWQKTLGGEGSEELTSIIQTKDGGYLVAGISDSGKSGNKTSENKGGKDYWLLKLDSKGEISWDKTFGGSKTEVLKSIVETEQNYFILGHSNSPGTNGNIKGFEAEILKLNKKGDVEKSFRFGENETTLLSSAYFDARNQVFHLAVISQNIRKKELIVLQVDKDLNTISTLKKELSQNQDINHLIFTREQEYLLAGSELKNVKDRHSNQRSVSNYQTMIIDRKGEMKWEKELKTDYFSYLQTALETRDGSVVLVGNSNSDAQGDKKAKAYGQQDYWVIKLGRKEGSTPKVFIEAYPNPTTDFVNIVVNADFKKASGKVINMAGQLVKEFPVPYRTTPVDLKNYPTGIYIITLQVDETQHSIKIFKK